MVQEIPLDIEIILITAVLIFLDTFYILVISPIVFNYFLIPRIEKRVGQKLKYHECLRYIVLGYFLYRHLFVSKYIVRRYLSYKFKGIKNIPITARETTLGRVGYTIDMVSRMEIFMSFMAAISRYSLIVLLMIFFIASGKINTFLSQLISFFSR